MTWLPICLFLALFANAKLESQFINRLPRDAAETTTEETAAPPATTATTTTTENQENKKKDGEECDANTLNDIVCENDKLKFCGPNNQIMSIPCVVKGKQGFCNCEKTGCVAQRPVCPNDKTKCYQPNTKLPDNMDCHKFTYCNEKKEKLTLQCPGNLIYNMTAEKCMDHNSAKCSRVVCPKPGIGLQLIPFPQAKNFYVLCYQGMGEVRKCPDKYYGIRDNRCKFDCKLRGASGLFKDSNLESCKKGVYYACKRSGTTYTTIPAQCPEGLTFDEELGLCTSEDTCTETASETIA